MSTANAAKPEHGSEQPKVSASAEAILETRVRQHLEVLGLPCLGKSLDEILAWARKERPGALGLIGRAVAADAERVVTRAVEGRLKQSGLPERPTLETFDFDFQPTLIRRPAHVGRSGTPAGRR